MSVDVNGPNDLLRVARLRLPSPLWPGRRMSRQELGEAVAAKIREDTGRLDAVDERDIGRLERGDTRWPRSERRAALRAVLGAETDAQLGLCPARRTVDDAFADTVGLPAITSTPTSATLIVQGEIELADGEDARRDPHSVLRPNAELRARFKPGGITDHGSAVAADGSDTPEGALRVTVQGQGVADVRVVIYVGAEMTQHHDRLELAMGTDAQVYSLTAPAGNNARD